MFCLAALTLTLTGFTAGTNAVFSPPDASLLLPGRFVYQKNCVFCHGRRGDGTGEMGLTVKPRPRDFTTGTFKYRSTPSGALPTDADLVRTIRRGIAGTAMPAFESLPERDVRAVIQYVKSFSPRWKEAVNFAPPVIVPDPPRWFGDAREAAVHAGKGAALFARMCAPCHGATGAGDGVAAKNELADAWGHPVTPADLRFPQLRSGREWQDIHRVLVTGLNGTPMPSFAESTTIEERWDLIAFIAELRRTHAIDPAR